MAKMQKWGLRVVLFLTLCLGVSMRPVRAEVLVAKTYELKNVMKAEAPAGKWVEKNGVVRFKQEGGSYIKSRWIRVNDKIYYMDKTGARADGWVKYRSGLYYLRAVKGGALHLGWMTKGGKRYYFKSNGSIARGMYAVEGVTYYFDRETGAAKTGWIKEGRHEYYFSPKTYKLKTSCWVKTDGKYYYVNKKGQKRSSGWIKVDGKKYYLDTDKSRVTGELYIGNKGYYFDKNGVYDPKVKVKPEVDTSKPMVALTFDDGPGPYTNRLLDCLKKNKAKATFFMVGSNVLNYKSVVKKMAEMGCELGNHSYSHPQMSRLSDAAIASEVSRTSKNIKSASGQNPTLFRLPYGDGASNKRVLSALGLPSIYWSIDTRDWANTGNSAHTVNEVLNFVKNGDIILMHDIHWATVTAAETIIPELKRRGYQLVTVSQLAKYKGETTLSKGKTYYSFR